MPIYAPGKRDKKNRRTLGKKRSAVVMLSLTAMVDMFTVLVVFLLQNYNTTGEVIEISDQVELPQAMAVKEIKPAHVIVVSKDKIMLDKELVATFAQVKAQTDWKIEVLFNKMIDAFRKAEEKRKLLGLEKVRDAIDQSQPGLAQKKEDDMRRVTVQADKKVDFLTIKKVMTTLTMAGASEINFAVMKEEGKKEAAN